ncbi:hypothetical protein KY285_026891 [Solanum tuberosum]|nr:hypothetical protein KY285_026891 [Solanum tuberosum]
MLEEAKLPFLEQRLRRRAKEGSDSSTEHDSEKTRMNKTKTSETDPINFKDFWFSNHGEIQKSLKRGREGSWALQARRTTTFLRICRIDTTGRWISGILGVKSVWFRERRRRRRGG